MAVTCICLYYTIYLLYSNRFINTNVGTHVKKYYFPFHHTETHYFHIKTYENATSKSSLLRAQNHVEREFDVSFRFSAIMISGSCTRCTAFISFRARSQPISKNAHISFVIFVCRPHVKTREPINGFSLNLILGKLQFADNILVNVGRCPTTDTLPSYVSVV